MTIRQQIINAKEKLGWSYGRLARESGLSEPTVRKYISGKIDTSTEKADAMLAAMKKAERG